MYIRILSRHPASLQSAAIQFKETNIYLYNLLYIRKKMKGAFDSLSTWREGGFSLYLGPYLGPPFMRMYLGGDPSILLQRIALGAKRRGP